MKPESNERAIILAAVDGTPQMSEVIHAAVAAARSYPDGEIHFVFVADPTVGTMLQSTTHLVEHGRTVLASAIARVSELHVGHFESHLEVGLAAKGILRTAERLVAALIVVGPNHRGGSALDSVTSAVVDGASCNVMVARRRSLQVAVSTAHRSRLAGSASRWRRADSGSVAPSLAPRPSR